MFDSISVKDFFTGLVGILAGIAIIKDSVAPYFTIKTKHGKEIESLREELRIGLSELIKSREEDRELKQLLLEGVTATLESLHNAGNNGPVTIALDKLERFKNYKAVV